MGESQERTQISRRRLLRNAAAAGAGMALAPGLARVASGSARAQGTGGLGHVAVLGGGNAGLTVAHELIERGFTVSVHEAKALGGKSRSIPVPGSAEGGRAPLPGEHGFRFFPGFYQNTIDTLQRIPYPGNPNGVYDNLVEASETLWVRDDGRANSRFLGLFPGTADELSVEGLQRLLEKEFVEMQALPPQEAAYLAQRIMVFMTSSEERRFGEWEHLSWWDFIGAEHRSKEYRRVAGYGMSTLLVAGEPRLASARTIGTVAEAFILAVLGRGYDAPPARILDAPTNEAWIDRWVDKLRELGVRFDVGKTVEELAVEEPRGQGHRDEGPRIAAALARDQRGRRHTIEADWFVCALPVERARRLMSTDILRHDPQLAAMDDLMVAWMSGIMYYLREPVDLPAGHMAFLDTPWAITAIAQQQFWQERDFADDYGDGEAVDCLSAIVSNWETPGQLNGKPARSCTAEEIQAEVWAQMKAGLEKDRDDEVLPDDIVHTWFLDPAITWSEERQRNRSSEPLMINTVGSWEKRPGPETAIPNLLLAGDYVQTSVDLATMEAADESARRAVNVLLDGAQSAAPRARVHELFAPPEFEGIKELDAQWYRLGQRHPMDVRI